MDDHSLQLRVSYEDLPDLIELSVRVIHGEWSAVSTAYASPLFLTEECKGLLRWVEAPGRPLRLEAGADTGIGWMVLQFYTIDRAGHARCAITRCKNANARAMSCRDITVAIELPTELGLVERFARECIALGTDFKRQARLIGLPT
jgi:hypothetical protein